MSAGILSCSVIIIQMALRRGESELEVLVMRLYRSSRGNEQRFESEARGEVLKSARGHAAYPTSVCQVNTDWADSLDKPSQPPGKAQGDHQLNKPLTTSPLTSSRG